MFNAPVTFQQAADQLSSRMDRPTAMKYQAIVSTWDANARRHAFFSSRVAESGILGELHRRAQAVVEGKMSRDQARRLLREYFVGEGADALAALGFAPPKDARGVTQLASIPRLELILDTNVRMAQETGHWQKWKRMSKVYPYGIWRVGVCDNHRRSHLERDGKVYAFDHPIWTHSPPGGEFHCHCRRELATEEDLEDMGVKPEPNDSSFEPSSLGFDPSADDFPEPPVGKRVPDPIAKKAEQKMKEDAERLKLEEETAAAEKAQQEAEAKAKEEAARQAAEEAERYQRELEARIKAEEEERKKAEAEAARKAEEEAAKKAEEERKKAEHIAHRMEQLERARAGRKEREKKLKADMTKAGKDLEEILINNGKNDEKVKQVVARMGDMLRTQAHYAGKKFAGFDRDKYLKDFIDKTEKKLQKAIDSAIVKLDKEKKAAEAEGTYPGIWFNQAPTPADYIALKDSIPKKMDYFKTHHGHDDKIAQLLDFETKGKLHEAGIRKAMAAKDKADVRHSSFILNNYDNPFTGAYTQERKDAAKWFTNTNGGFPAADAYYKKNDTYKNAPQKEKAAAYAYTAGSGGFNRPLSGFDGDWYHFKGIGKVPLNNEGREQDIEELTKIIAKSKYPDDCWTQRGDPDLNSYNSFLGEHLTFSMSEDELKKRLVGKEFINYAFLSTGVNKGSGFAGSVITNVYIPAGTPALYCDPFSCYKHSKGYNENELLLQRGMKYKILKVEKRAGTVYIDIEVHPEQGFKFLK